MAKRPFPFGQAPNRTYKTGGDPTKRRFENDAWERARQEKYATTEVRADGEHYNPTLPNGYVPISLEASERQYEQNYRPDRWGGFKAFCSVLTGTAWHMGMYSSNPETARMAIVHTAGEQIGVQRQSAADREQQMAAQHARERAEDAAAADARMVCMAKEMAKAMFDEADRRRTA